MLQLTHIGLVLERVCTVVSATMEVRSPLTGETAIISIAFFGRTKSLEAEMNSVGYSRLHSKANSNA